MTDDRISELREDLRALRRQLVRQEIDLPTYESIKQEVLADLSPEERVALGTSTPQPIGPTPGPIRLSGGETRLSGTATLDYEAGDLLLDQFRIERELGRGGFGAVYEATDVRLAETFAVKVLDPAMVARPELLARFRREVSLMRALQHHRIVRVYDYREAPEQQLALISMELVPGCSLREVVDAARESGAEVPLELALRVLQQMLEGLAQAHEQGVVHRDVTPNNVLLAGGTAQELLQAPDTDPQVKLVDFGIAGLVERSELSKKSLVAGTAAYMAPEVLEEGDAVGPQADVYGAGAVAYQLVTGRLPLGRFKRPGQLRPELGEQAQELLLRMLDGDPADRPDAGEAAAAAAGQVQGLQAAAAQAEADREAEVRRQAEAQIQAERQQRERQQLQRSEKEEARRRQQDQEQEAERARKRQAAERKQQRPAPPAGAPGRQAETPGGAATRSGGLPMGPMAAAGVLIAVVVAIALWVGSQSAPTQPAGGAAQKQQPKSTQGPSNGGAAADVPAADIEWVPIRGGSFQMGCTAGDGNCYDDEKPRHAVTVRSFRMAATETTNGQYQACVAAGRCARVSSEGGTTSPVVRVDWNEAKAFCEWADGRLPSEAEWEYAARGGQSEWKYPWGNSISHDNANYTGTGGTDRWDSGAAPVKSFAANAYGLYDMAGNVWEWVQDPWHGTYQGAPSDGSAWTSGGSSSSSSSSRVLRGGSWINIPGFLRVSFRGGSVTGVRSGSNGFRCARTDS